eukprot:EC718451.1.p1 GENE.EC718451.1~~EC718451.1.p1  ORF type:complete len:63 (+),score=8.43 EC718451.1:39-227(+)
MFSDDRGEIGELARGVETGGAQGARTGGRSGAVMGHVQTGARAAVAARPRSRDAVGALTRRR